MSTPEVELKHHLSALKSLGMNDDTDRNYAIAKNILHEELGLFDNKYPLQIYDLTKEASDRLLANGRQDSSHSLVNTISILSKIKQTTAFIKTIILLQIIITSVLLYIVWKLWKINL